MSAILGVQRSSFQPPRGLPAFVGVLPESSTFNKKLGQSYEVALPLTFCDGIAPVRTQWAHDVADGVTPSRTLPVRIDVHDQDFPA
jgi:hypothetical protein